MVGYLYQCLLPLHMRTNNEHVTARVRATSRWQGQMYYLYYGFARQLRVVPAAAPCRPTSVAVTVCAAAPRDGDGSARAVRRADDSLMNDVSGGAHTQLATRSASA